MVKIRNKWAAITAVVAALAILATGTFAWLEITQVAEMRAMLEYEPHQATARLHNNQQWIGESYGRHIWQVGMTSDAGVYVENFSDDPDHEVFVRVRLLEYMETGERAIMHPDEAGFATATYTPFVAGASRTDHATWAVRTPVDTHNFGNHWDWSFGGSKYFMPTFNMDIMSRMSDVKGQAIDPALHATGEPPMDTRRGGQYEYPLEAGLNNFWRAGDTHSARVKYYHVGFQQHRITDNPQTHEARRTLNAEVRRLSEWDGTFGEFWLWDDDGWAYWGQPLGGGQATGMLLNSFTLTQRPASQVYYAIIADMQAATIGEWENEFTMYSNRPLSDAGRDFMSLVTGGKPSVGGIFTDRETGIQWRVLAEDGDYRLVMTEHVHNVGVQFNTTNAFVRWHLLTPTQPIRAEMDAFWAAKIGPQLRGLAVPANGLDTDVRTAPGNWNETENQPAGRTTPGTGTASATNALFILSLSEVNQYLPTVADRIGHDIDGTARGWWLRSPGHVTTSPVANVGPGGARGGSYTTNTTRGFRPAMWVRP